MDLIERYLAEVERHLPKRLRDDVSRELRSNIEDSADVRTGGDPGGRETVVRGILAEYGPPAEMARFYLPKRYVVGPRYYDTFWATVKITFLVLAGLIGLGIAVDLLTTETTFRDVLWLIVKSAGEFPGTAVTFLGIITVIFAVIERVAEPRSADPAEIEGWDPDTLPPLEDTARINRVSHAVDICLYIGLFFFFNFFRQYAGVFNHTNGQWWFLPLAGPGFESHLLWLNLWWAASLATTVAILRTGRWTTWTRTAKTVLAALLVVILFRMAFDTELVGLPEGWPPDAAGFDPLQVKIADSITPVIGKMARFGMGIAAVVTAFGVLKRFVRKIRSWVRA